MLDISNICPYNQYITENNYELILNQCSKDIKIIENKILF